MDKQIMKKVTLLLPDQVLHIIGNSRHAHTVLEDLTAERLIDMLCLDDYHETYRLRRDQVQVLSVEEHTL
jgi:hypothetical protein